MTDFSLEDYIADASYNAPEIKAEKAQLRSDILKCLEKLPKRDKDIIISRFGLYNQKTKTLEELGKQYGFSKERIRQLESEILKRIKNTKQIQHLKDYLN